MKSLQTMAIIKGMIIILLITSPIFAQHHVYLRVPNSIPNYCQENSIWCGAATSQMILEGYPGGLNHAYAQSDIWDTIQVHKQETGWATDPDGLRSALMILGGDPGVHWSIFKNSQSDDILYSITYWMTRRQFPVATLVWGFQHWVAITGFTTDVDPTVSDTANLLWIEIDNPWNPPCPTASSGGVTAWVSGATWLSSYWPAPGNYATSKWNGNYVAVIEPPEKRGAVRVPQKLPDKGALILERTALENAARAVKESKLPNREKYRLLQQAVPLKALLVNSESHGYYLVPLGYREGAVAEGAVIVNAYNGEIEEIGVFRQPQTFLTREEAMRLALSHICACDAKCQVRLTFQPSLQMNSRFMPVWEVTARIKKKDFRVYVTQDGRIFDDLVPLPPGD